MKSKKQNSKYIVKIVDTTDYSDKRCVICGHAFKPEIVTVILEQAGENFRGFICPECIKIAHIDGDIGNFPLWYTFYMQDTCRIISSLKKSFLKNKLLKIVDLIGEDIGVAIDEFRINRELIEPSRQVSKILQAIEYLEGKDELREELLNKRVCIPMWIEYQEIKAKKEQEDTNSRVVNINGKKRGIFN